MFNYEQNFQTYIHQNKINCEQLIFKKSCHSVEDAMKASGAKRDEFVKNICLIDTNGNLIVGIIKGEDRLDIKKVVVSLNSINTLNVSNKLQLASPEKILEKTGYPCGGTPSFGYAAIFLIDSRVMEKDIIYSGGGSESSLVRISSKELQKANGGKIVNIKKSI